MMYGYVRTFTFSSFFLFLFPTNICTFNKTHIQRHTHRSSDIRRMKNLPQQLLGILRGKIKKILNLLTHTPTNNYTVLLVYVIYTYTYAHMACT